jgi:hypothetical protein
LASLGSFVSLGFVRDEELPVGERRYGENEGKLDEAEDERPEVEDPVTDPPDEWADVHGGIAAWSGGRGSCG